MVHSHTWSMSTGCNMVNYTTKVFDLVIVIVIVGHAWNYTQMQTIKLHSDLTGSAAKRSRSHKVLLYAGPVSDMLFISTHVIS